MRVSTVRVPRQPLKRIEAGQLLIAGIILATSVFVARTATAHHLCLDDAVVTGNIQTKWQVLGGSSGALGCPLSEEADVPGGDGRFNQFEHGQMIWSPKQKLVIAAVEANTRDSIDLHWWITDQYQYDAFSIHWIKWVDSSLDDNSHDVSHDDPNMSRTDGALTIPPEYPKQKITGRYQVQIEGCDRHYPLNSTCNQGWSNWVTIDVGYLDVTHQADGTRLDVASKFADVPGAAAALRVSALAASCRGDLGDLGEGFATTAYSRLAIAPQLGGGPGGTGTLPANTCGPANVSDLVKGVNDAIGAAKVTGDVGSDVDVSEGAGVGAAPGIVIGGVLFGPLGAALGGIVTGSAGLAACSRSGNYDMTLTALIPLAFEQAYQLDGPTFHHLLFDLLNQTGGSDKVVTSINACYLTIPETENHILSTESSRYLTNQLRWSYYPQDLYPPGSAQYVKDQNIYDNEVNGLEDWMLDYLQGFLTNDFHEYNARPYARLTIRALQNLANYAQGDFKVRDAAALVLDYLAAKFVVSSSGLRRAVPYRRRAERVDYPWLYGNESDEETWYFLEQSAALKQIDDLAFGHADWGAPGTMVYASSGTYRVPDLILDLFLNPPDVGTLQAFRHEGIEIYAREREFLIGGGGRWEDSLSRDLVLGQGTDDTKGQALATILLPTGEGISRGDLVQIQGDKDATKRDNSCVARGFACGLNPLVPDAMLRRFPQGPGLSDHCLVAVTDAAIYSEWQRRGGESGDLQCPTGPDQPTADGVGVQQTFVRGEIVESKAQNMLVTAIYDKGANALDIEWQITAQFNYDHFNVRWDKDGVNVDQQQVNHDALGASRTGGTYSIPLKGFGSYRVAVEGCDVDLIGNSTCRQGWSSPVMLDYPGSESCARAANNWVFVDGLPRCTGTRSHGYFAAVFRAPCPSTASCHDQQFGFFEAIAAGFDARTLFAPSLATYVNRTLAANGSTVFTSDGSNTFHTWDGRAIAFTPNHASDQWGISDMAGDRMLPTSVDAWHLAVGNPIVSSGKGCVIVTNPNLNQALVLDFTRPHNPLPAAVVPLPNGTPTCTN